MFLLVNKLLWSILFLNMYTYSFEKMKITQLCTFISTKLGSIHFIIYLHSDLVTTGFFLKFLVFLITAILTGMRRVVSHCDFDYISVTISDVEHLLYTCWPFVGLSQKNVYYLFIYFALLSCMTSVYILDTNPLFR